MKFNITRVGNDGEGIAYYKNKPVFIYYAYKNEIVEGDLFTNKRDSYEATIQNIIKPSKFRIIEKCPYYGKCGGCNLMHINYQEALNYKKETVSFLFNNKLKEETNKTIINNTHKSDEIFNYRNKINVPVKLINGKNAIGLFKRGSNDFLQINECITQNNNLNILANQVLLAMNKFLINAYDSKTNTGSIVNLSIRTNLEGKMQLTFVLKNNKNLDEISGYLMKNNKNLVSVYESFVPNYKTNRDMFKGKLKHIKGHLKLEMKISNFKFFLTPNSFFQLNANQAVKLYELVIKKANFKKSDVILDAYSGVGTISTFISSHVKKVIAVESIKDATLAHIESNKINNILNVKPITGDFVKVSTYLKEKFDVMIFDPPRLGLGKEIINYILKEKPKKIIYVSCGMQSLVNDLKELALLYDIISTDPLDMFPQTSHIESVNVLVLK